MVLVRGLHVMAVVGGGQTYTTDRTGTTVCRIPPEWKLVSLTPAAGLSLSTISGPTAISTVPFGLQMLSAQAPPQVSLESPAHVMLQLESPSDQESTTSLPQKHWLLSSVPATL